MFRKLAANTQRKRVTITIDGSATEVEEGETLAAILLRREPFTTRLTPISGAARAPYCMMGACFECLVQVDGVTSTRSCMTRASEGMDIRLQTFRPDPAGTVRA